MERQELYDLDLIDEISARLNLRRANQEAVESVIFDLGRHYDIDRLPRPFEAVVDVATGVGKTYIMAGLMDYLAAEGVRNFAIIAPGRTILTKTINQFSEGHPKSLVDAMSTQPVVITSDNFQSPETRRLIADEGTVKLYVFTVHALVRPTSKAGRKTHAFDETLGDAFYSMLQKVDDLVVLADEHHVYASPAFSRTIRDLDPMAMVGLTATPHPKTPESSIVYRYPLAAAIADKVVKTPVLVGRADDRDDVRTKLQDGIRLLDLKTKAVTSYREHHPGPTVNPVMLVIARSIADAEEITSTLEASDFDGGSLHGRVLTVHSDAPDDALAALEQLEEFDSPYRVVISVGMLKEGWDVKSVYVIASMRASVSEILTEQTLGRGLRLPFGRYTGVEILDTLEVLGHDRYEDLLRKSGTLNEQFIDRRTRSVLRPDADGALVPIREDIVVQVPIMGTANSTLNVAESNQDDASSSVTSGEKALWTADRPTWNGLKVQTVGSIVTTTERELQQLTLQLPPVDGRPSIRLPVVHTVAIESSFSLADIIDTTPFRDLGRRLAADPSGVLRRVRLSARRVVDASGRVQVHMVTSPATDIVLSPAYTLPIGDLRNELTRLLIGSSVVVARHNEARPARDLVDAFVDGLGPQAELVLSAALDRAGAALIDLVTAEARRLAPPVIPTEVVDLVPVTTIRQGRPDTSPDRYGPFRRGVGYEFEKSVYAQDWFDSAPERDLANALDTSSQIAVWLRLQRNDLPIEWMRTRSYNPDFVAVESSGDYFLLEVKADRDIDDSAVRAKREAARRWANHVNKSGTFEGRWRYLLLGSADIEQSRGDWTALRSIAI